MRTDLLVNGAILLGLVLAWGCAFAWAAAGAPMPRFERLRAWWARHYQAETFSAGGTIPPPQHVRCRCALVTDEHNVMMDALFGRGEPFVETTPDGWTRAGVRYRFQPYRPAERPIALAAARCRWCPTIVPREQLAAHEHAHRN